MRLKPKEIAAIKSSFQTYYSSGKVYLFGSRVDDSKKGGDIDLLWVVPESDLQKCLEYKTQIKYLIQDKIGEQKIDITITTLQKMQTDPFLVSLTDKVEL